MAGGRGSACNQPFYPTLAVAHDASSGPLISKHAKRLAGETPQGTEPAAEFFGMNAEFFGMNAVMALGKRNEFVLKHSWDKTFVAQHHDPNG